jgi:DNA polymerase III psi subunit
MRTEAFLGIDEWKCKTEQDPLDPLFHSLCFDDLKSERCAQNALWMQFCIDVGGNSVIYRS